MLLWKYSFRGLDIELLTPGFHPYYLPREFTSVNWYQPVCNVISFVVEPSVGSNMLHIFYKSVAENRENLEKNKIKYKLIKKAGSVLDPLELIV